MRIYTNHDCMICVLCVVVIDILIEQGTSDRSLAIYLHKRDTVTAVGLEDTRLAYSCLKQQ
jgi:hypothetical protein